MGPTKTFLLLTAVGLTAVTAAFAHEGATGIVKERMATMKGIGDAAKGLARMAKGQDSFDQNRVQALSATLQNHAGADLRRLFPKGSLDHPSEALPSIWEDWDAYERQWVKMREAAQALTPATVVDSASLKPVLGQLSATCKACHEDFRKPK